MKAATSYRVFSIPTSGNYHLHLQTTTLHYCVESRSGKQKQGSIVWIKIHLLFTRWQFPGDFFMNSVNIGMATDAQFAHGE